MPWIRRGARRVWLGQHMTLGPIIVPEGEIQKQDDDLMAYVAADRTVHKFKAAVLRTNIQRRGLTEEQAAQTLDSFDEGARQNHHKYLSGLRNAYNEGSLQESTVAKHRSSQCWRCKAHVDSDLNLECALCNWIACQCGACGCRSDEPPF